MNTNPADSNELMALASLNSSLATTRRSTSLADVVKARTRRSLLLVDTSGSMSEPVKAYDFDGSKRIDALREVLTDLRKTHRVPVVSFNTTVEVVDGYAPNPTGQTYMHLAIEFATREGASHVVMITDGEPDCPDQTIEAARKFGGVIDVFYVGDGTNDGAAFAARLAAVTGGTCNVDSLGNPKQLAGKVTLLLGEGQRVLGDGQ